jgi:hypothetical protein
VIFPVFIDRPHFGMVTRWIRSSVINAPPRRGM